MQDTKDHSFLAIALILLGLILLAGINKYFAEIPYTPPHIMAAPYVWMGECQKDLYEKNGMSCECVNDQYKISSWDMIKYGIRTQRSLGLYRVGNDLIEVSKDFSNICTAKNVYHKIFYQR